MLLARPADPNDTQWAVAATLLAGSIVVGLHPDHVQLPCQGGFPPIIFFHFLPELP